MIQSNLFTFVGLFPSKITKKLPDSTITHMLQVPQEQNTGIMSLCDCVKNHYFEDATAFKALVLPPNLSV